MVIMQDVAISHGTAEDCYLNDKRQLQALDATVSMTDLGFRITLDAIGWIRRIAVIGWDDFHGIR